MNPRLLFFWLSCPPISVFKSSDRKNKSTAEEGLRIEACTHSQHLALTPGFVFPSSHTVRRQSIKRGEPRQMPSLPHTAESTVREEHFSSRRVSARLGVRGLEGCSGGASEVQRCQAGCLQSHALSKPLFYCH